MTTKLSQVLSHPVKLEILKSITAQSKSVDKISQGVSLSVQETSIHLERLHEAGLVDKEPDGTFLASSLGQLTLSLLLDFDFVAKHSDYFREFDLSLLPISFVERLGELKESERMEGTVNNLQYTKRLFGRARKSIWIIANEVMLDAVPVVREKINQGVNFRFIIDQTFKPPAEFEITMPGFWRRIWKIPAAVVVTDKEAMVFFLNRKLHVDYEVGFESTEPTFMKWCEDLVEHLWNQGQKLE
jgi:predicted transcriptional regulator